MDVRLFAEKYGLKAKRDECGEHIIPGRLGQIYEYGAGRFGCMVMASSARHWNTARRKLGTAGCQVIQNGDTEGTALFDPQDNSQVKVAIGLVGAKQRRRVSEAQRAALVERLRQFRKDPGIPEQRSISQRTPCSGGFAGRISIEKAPEGLAATQASKSRVAALKAVETANTERGIEESKLENLAVRIDKDPFRVRSEAAG
jgi:hypothetical protein